MIDYPKNDFRYYTEDYLEHFGVKGMKWGKRKKLPTPYIDKEGRYFYGGRWVSKEYLRELNSNTFGSDDRSNKLKKENGYRRDVGKVSKYRFKDAKRRSNFKKNKKKIEPKLLVAQIFKKKGKKRIKRR